jgi:hypothetical protein
MSKERRATPTKSAEFLHPGGTLNMGHSPVLLSSQEVDVFFSELTGVYTHHPRNTAKLDAFYEKWTERMRVPAPTEQPRADTIRITTAHLDRLQHITFRVEGLKVLAGEAVESDTPNQAITAIHGFLEDLAREANALDEELHDLRGGAE